jgi:hypothetical protein
MRYGRRFVTGLALAAAVTSGVALVSNSAGATTIPVSNPSFEILPDAGLPFGGCGTGCSYSIDAIPGWTNGGFSGQFQPGSFFGNFAYFNSVPDGFTVAYANGGLISQTLGTTTVAGDTYTLQVAVGLRSDGNFSPSIVSLILGSNTFVATGSIPTAGNWSIYTATGTASASGQAIAIDLFSTGGGQGDYDNVQLSASATPLPSTWMMLLAGFVGLGFLAFGKSKRGDVAVA